MKNPEPLDPVEGLPEMVQQLIEANRSAMDPLGSYTGFPKGAPWEKPVQDADDL